GVWAHAIAAVREAMGEEPFGSAEDFLSRVDLRKVNKRAVESLVKAGALESLDPDRGGVVGKLSRLMETAQESARRRGSGQFSLFGETVAPLPSRGPDRKPPVSTWSRREVPRPS